MGATNGDGVRVLVVDDEPAIRRYLRISLMAHGHTVFEAATGQAAVTAVSAQRPDLVLLDLGLPDLNGIEVTRLLREWSQIPIIIISVNEQEADKIAALDAGADDYMTKPFSLGELLARMRVAIRRAGPSKTEPVFAVGDLTVDLGRRAVMVAGRRVELTPTEYDLLRTLVTHAGKVLTHRHLLHEVWHGEQEQNMHMLRVNVSNLRHKIERDAARPEYILTEPGVGYRLRVGASS
jgi:two-component system KDP operon response regulator KdpE